MDTEEVGNMDRLQRVAPMQQLWHGMTFDYNKSLGFAYSQMSELHLAKWKAGLCTMALV